MRTVFKTATWHPTALVILGLCAMLLGNSNHAQAEPVAAVAPPAAPIAAPPMIVAPPATASGSAVAMPASATAPDISLSSTDVASENTLSSAEAKVPNSVKNVMKRLDNAGENITIDDLNSARQAIAKVEVLIELEKKLGELDKARNDRTGKVNTLANAIPASAFNAPPQGNFSVAANSFPSAAPMPSFGGGKLDIMRIIALRGNYKAVIRDSTGDGRTIEVGDVMPDDRTVSSINATSVTLVDHKGTKEHVNIKNVDKVFGSSP